MALEDHRIHSHTTSEYALPVPFLIADILKFR